MQKATHSGTCQICGRAQKLPSGLLSKHGYTTRWGFFSGVCTGAEHQPFELSKDLIDAAIARSEHEAAALEAEADALENDANPDSVWVGFYRAATWENRRSRTEWLHVPVSELEITSKDYDGWTSTRIFYSEEQNRHEIDAFNTSAATGERLQKENYRYAHTRRTLAKQHREYVAWQRSRIADWQPKALTPVKAA